MLTLYPDIKPYLSHSLDVESPHILYIEECGNPAGLPVVVIHGGPGAGCEPYHRRFFDPQVYHIVLFDQRGCGRSSPHAALENNNTQAHVHDMETIREHLKIDRWVIFGGSWGTTLGLVYAQTHPERVMGMILRGVFLCRPHEIQWFYQQGANQVFPDYWQDFIAPIPQNEQHAILQAYYERLTGEDELVRMAAAKAWSNWEARTATLLPHKAVIDHFTNPFTALSLARIECHYFVNNAFLQPDQILKNAYRLKDIPGIITHGRYDLICPVESAWSLSKAWSGAELNIIPNTGHSATETNMIDALVKATRAMSRFLQ